MHQNQEEDTGKYKPDCIHDEYVKEQKQKDTDKEYKPFFEIDAVSVRTAVPDNAFNKDESGQDLDKHTNPEGEERCSDIWRPSTRVIHDHAVVGAKGKNSEQR